MINVEMKTHLRKQIIILGGGIAGLAAALRIARAPGFRREFNVILVDQNCYHLYHGLLYAVATADYHIKPEDLQYLEGGACIRLKALGELAMKSKIDFIQARVVGVDPSRRRILLDRQPEIAYDELIVALGAQPAFFDIPGLSERALTLYSIPDALKIRERMKALFDEPGQRQRRIVIGGGGFTGVELAGELLRSIRRRERLGQLAKGAVTLTIVEAGKGLLGPLGPGVGAAAEQRLKSLGGQLVFQVPVTHVTDTTVVLNDGRDFPYDVLIWTGGVQANPLIQSLGYPVTPRGQIAVDEYLRVSAEDHVWAAGDCMAWIDPETQRPLPQTAPQAVAAGETVADNIVSAIIESPLRKFVPARRGFVVPIGGTYAIAQTRTGMLTGFVAWCQRKRIDFNYLRSIMSFRNAVRVFLRGERIYLKSG